MPLGGTNDALHHRKFCDTQRRYVSSRLEQHSDVKVVFQQIGCGDDLVVFSIEERDALAGQRYEGDLRRCLRSSGDQRRDFGAALRRIFRPSSSLANIDELDWRGSMDFVRHLEK